MPQPLKGSYQLEYRPKIVLERPLHAARIGLIAAEWTALERELAFGLAFNLFAFSKRERGAKAIVETILHNIDSLTARLDVIEAMIQPRIDPAAFTYFAEKLRPEVRRRARDRNKIVHGLWQICSKYPDDLILAPHGAQPMRYSVKDLDEIADRINQTLNDVATFCHLVQRDDWPTPPSAVP